MFLTCVASFPVVCFLRFPPVGGASDLRSRLSDDDIFSSCWTLDVTVHRTHLESRITKEERRG